MAELSEEELYSALEEAQGSAVIEERSTVGGVVNFWFSHAFFRQTLYEEVFTPRRIRLHQQVAQALEEVYTARLEEHAAELAEHFSHSSDPSALAKAVEYGEMAAQRATAVYAYGEGVGHLERCLQVQEVLASSAGSGQAPEDKEKRCDLLLVLGGTQILAGETRRMLDEVAPEAFALAEAMGDEMRASRACQLAIHGLAAYGGPQAFGNPEGTRWAERADQYAQPDTVERAWADMSLGTARFATGDPREVYALLSRALDLARRLDDPDAFAWVGVFWLILVTAPQHGEEGLRVAEELVTLYHANVSGRNLGSMFMFTGSTSLN